MIPLFRIWCVLCWLSCLSWGCDPAPASAPPEPSGEALGTNAAIIRNPVDQGSGLIDTARVAKMAFTTAEYDFGSVTSGTVVTHDFTFVNTGTVPLLITDARSTCGCTVSNHPEAPVAPGATGAISVAFNTANRSGTQRKPITITANTYPATTTLYVAGLVTTPNTK